MGNKFKTQQDEQRINTAALHEYLKQTGKQKAISCIRMKCKTRKREKRKRTKRKMKLN